MPMGEEKETISIMKQTTSNLRELWAELVITVETANKRYEKINEKLEKVRGKIKRIL